LRRVAQLLVAVEPAAYELTVPGLLALAGPVAINRGRLSPLAE